MIIFVPCLNVRIERAPGLPPTPTAVLSSVVVPVAPQPLSLPQAAPTAMVVVPEATCLLPDLALGEHISADRSYTKTQWSASGEMACRIERDSCEYHYLVGILEPTIVFKREEQAPFDTEDILMHPAMLQPLSRLNKLVQAEWGNTVQLRVTDAYDSLLEHDLNQSDPGRKYSLHFEGRAIDLTTWPINRQLYGRLCALAHCAGFDWVQNEGTHCHASISAKSLCFQCRN